MEKSMNKSMGSGGIKLPIGYRFHPTDEELIVHYLRRKIFGVPLPASVIPELLDVFQHDPWTLPGDLKEKRYFFGRKLGNNESKIAAGSGYWKPIGKSKPILTCLNHLVGVRKTLFFYQVPQPKVSSHASKFQWVLQEYHLLGSAPKISHKIQVSKSNLGEWVVYSLSQRRRRPTKQHKINSESSSSNTTTTTTTTTTEQLIIHSN